MFYTESFEKAAAVSAQALRLMSERGIPANPVNFSIWYSYIVGNNPDMTRSVDEFISSGDDWSVERSEWLFQKFFGNGGVGPHVAETSAELEKQIEKILEAMRATSTGNSGSTEKLAGYSTALTSGSRDSDIGAIVRNILLETQDILSRSKDLENKLEESKREITDLRESLREVREEAQTDGLTGIANRKFFDQRLAFEAIAAVENNSPLSLLLMDIDHFKKFNDNFGHRIGDSVLKVVARKLKDNIKGADLASRYGGEEFAVILPDTKLEDALTLANQIREKLAKRELKNSKTGDSYGTVTLSIGVSLYHPGEPLSELVQRADEALYRAKGAGRNRVAGEREPAIASVSMAS